MQLSGLAEKRNHLGNSSCEGNPVTFLFIRHLFYACVAISKWSDGLSAKLGVDRNQDTMVVY